MLLWGTWAVVHVLVFSLMSGITHPYYSSAIAPAAAALTGAGFVEGWRLRDRVPWAGVLLASLLLVTAGWQMQLLGRAPAYLPGLGVGTLLLALAASIVLVVPTSAEDPNARRVARGAAVVGMAAILVGPSVWTAATVDRAISGGDPSSGPATGGGRGGRGGFAGFAGDPGGTDRALVDYLVANRGTATWLVAVSSASAAGPLQLASGVPVMAMGGFMGSDPAPTLAQLQLYVHDGRLRYVLIGGRGAGPGGFFGGDGQGSVAGSRNAWVQDACAPVSGIGGGSLYDCAGAA
jgi:4-amino-4-deoxy-L-arabinose transferase-like glycosyltransferase